MMLHSLKFVAFKALRQKFLVEGWSQESRLADHSLPPRNSWKEKTEILSAGQKCSTFWNSSVALKNIWRGRDQERNLRHKNKEQAAERLKEENLPREAVAPRNVHKQSSSLGSLQHRLSPVLEVCVWLKSWNDEAWMKREWEYFVINDWLMSTSKP